MILLESMLRSVCIFQIHLFYVLFDAGIRHFRRMCIFVGDGGGTQHRHHHTTSILSWMDRVCVCENDWSGMTEIVRHAIEERIYFIITYNSTLAWLSFSWNQQSQSQSLSQNCFQQLTTDFKATIEAWRTQPLYHSHKTVYSVFSLHTETDRDTHHFAYNRKWQR